MKLLYISTFLFSTDGQKKYGLPANSDSFFQKYLDVFSEVKVLGDPIKKYLDQNALAEMTDPRISIRVLKPNNAPRDFVNDRAVKKVLDEEIQKAEAILIKPSTRKGMMAIRLAKKYRKPYMVEMTGDIHNALMQSDSLLKRLYAPFLYYKIRKNMKDCPFGLYVTKDYLQNQYPIEGRMCGCSDVVLKDINDTILEKRLKRIKNRKETDTVNLALIGFYQGKMKGVDTAIRALSHLPQNYCLHILGNGTEENRKKWIEYGKEFDVFNRIFFPKPLKSSDLVLQWLDTIDAFVLPTRSEGLGRCVVEAISRGCPSFVTNICSMPELLPKECLHELGNDQQLAEQILSVMSDKQKESYYAKFNFQFSKRYEYNVLRQRRNDFLRLFKEYAESVIRVSE